MNVAACAVLVALAACATGVLAAAEAPAARPAKALVSTATITGQRARSLYLLHCAGCHQIDGHGAPASGVPTMIDTLGSYLGSEAGKAYLVQVPGARNANVSDAELAALVNWTVEAFSSKTIPTGYRPYTEDEVRRWRACPPVDIAAARLALETGSTAGIAQCERN
jgi:mono/diheme cytochrome c family protein